MKKESNNEGSFFDKSSMYFSNIKNGLIKNSEESGSIKDVDSFESKQIGFFDNIKNKIFSSKNENLKEEQAITIVKLSDSEKAGYLKNVLYSSNENLEILKNSVSKRFDEGVIKLNNLKDISIEVSQKAGNTVVEFSKDIDKNFTELEIKQKLIKCIAVLDLHFIISALTGFKSKYKSQSKTHLALIALIGLLTLIDNTKNSSENTLKLLSNESLQFNDLFENITFKSVLETTEPIILLIPNGNYILFILKLFI